MGTIIGIIVIGLIAGFLARLLVPGKDPMGVVGTLLLGLVGSAIGGGLLRLIGGNDGVGIVGAVVGSVIALLIFRAVKGKSAKPAPTR